MASTIERAERSSGGGEDAVVHQFDRGAGDRSVALRVLVVGPHRLARVGLVAMLADSPEVQIVRQARGDQAFDAAQALQPDLVLALWDDQAHWPGELAGISVPVVLVAEPGCVPPLDRLVDGGIRGYLLSDSSPSQLVAALVAAAEGLVVLDPSLNVSLPPVVEEPALLEGPLTERELQVLQLLAAGLPNKIISRQLGISEHTVKFHVASILSKLDAASRTEAVTRAARRGLLTL